MGVMLSPATMNMDVNDEPRASVSESSRVHFS